MGDVKPSMKSLNGLKGTGGDQRQTTCSACRYGIFAHQPRRWSRDPMGLIHANQADCHAVVAHG